VFHFATKITSSSGRKKKLYRVLTARKVFHVFCNKKLSESREKHNNGRLGKKALEREPAGKNSEKKKGAALSRGVPPTSKKDIPGL